MVKNSQSMSGKGKGKAQRAYVQPEEELIQESSTAAASPTARLSFRQRLNPLPFLRRKRGARDGDRRKDINTQHEKQEGDHLDIEVDVEEQILSGSNPPAASSLRQIDVRQGTRSDVESLDDADIAVDEVMFRPRDPRRDCRNWEDVLSDIDKRLLQTADEGNVLVEREHLQRVARMREDQAEDGGG
ncbi:hypothetical protein N7G274_002922 [Stereocaulon virgatum]|uniref:Uncharacterized protein n=1 Tax=Stereocaulon virgatum TaxID=373712 RepID=A0ABR4AEF3_9LECA